MAEADGLPAMAGLPDDELIDCLVRNGQPRWSAEQLRSNPPLRLAATAFFFDDEAATKGDLAAKQKVDFLREMWVKLRKEELVADDPNRMFTDHILDPKKLL